MNTLRTGMIAAVSGCLVVGAMLSGAAPATAAVPGQTCLVNQDTWVRNAPGGDVLYTVPAGNAVAITGGDVAGYLVGHGNGGAAGYVPDDSRYYSCYS